MEFPIKQQTDLNIINWTSNGPLNLRTLYSTKTLPSQLQWVPEHTWYM